MIQTAKIAPTSTVRVVWLGSAAAEAPFAPKGGVDMTNVDYKQERSSWHKYGASKAGNILYGREFGKRYQNSGVLSVVRV